MFGSGSRETQGSLELRGKGRSEDKNLRVGKHQGSTRKGAKKPIKNPRVGRDTDLRAAGQVARVPHQREQRARSKPGGGAETSHYLQTSGKATRGQVPASGGEDPHIKVLT